MTSRRWLTMTLSAALFGVALAGCLGDSKPGDAGGGGSKVTIRQAGSSTVLPVAQAWAEEYGRESPNTQIVVGGGGTGAGFKQFCRGEIDVSDASRPIKDSEKRDCEAAGIEPFEIPVAIDGVAIVVSKSNTFVDHLTVEELNRIWTQNESKQANLWSDLRPGWPQEKIVLYGPGTDSGTFDYFVEVVIHPADGKESKGRSDYTPSEDDNVLVQGVRASPHALAYFGLAYAEENSASVRTVAVDGGKGPVAPTAENVESGAYSPLSRPIYMYTDGKPTGPLLKYFEFGLSPEGQALVTDVGYIKLPEATRAEVLGKVRGA